MARPRVSNMRGRPPSLIVAARKTLKLQKDMKDILLDLEELQTRLVRLESLLAANRKAQRDRARLRVSSNPGIRGKGPNVRDIAFQVLSRRRKPMSIQELSNLVLKTKRGKAGGNFTQNLGAALARDTRFTRVARGLYSVKV